MLTYALLIFAIVLFILVAVNVPINQKVLNLLFLALTILLLLGQTSFGGHYLR